MSITVGGVSVTVGEGGGGGNNDDDKDKEKEKDDKDTDFLLDLLTTCGMKKKLEKIKCILKFIKEKHDDKDDDGKDDDKDDDDGNGDDDPVVIDDNCDCKGKRKRSGRTLKTIYCFIKCKLHGKTKDEKPSDNSEKPSDNSEKPTDNSGGNHDDNNDNSDNEKCKCKNMKEMSKGRIIKEIIKLKNKKEKAIDCFIECLVKSKPAKVVVIDPNGQDQGLMEDQEQDDKDKCKGIGCLIDDFLKPPKVVIEEADDSNNSQDQDGDKDEDKEKCEGIGCIIDDFLKPPNVVIIDPNDNGRDGQAQDKEDTLNADCTGLGCLIDDFLNPKTPADDNENFYEYDNYENQSVTRKEHLEREEDYSNFDEKVCKDKTSIGCLFENILQPGSENEYTDSNEYEYEEISAAGISDVMMDNVDKLLRGDLRIVL